MKKKRGNPNFVKGKPNPYRTKGGAKQENPKEVSNQAKSDNSKGTESTIGS